MVFTSASTVKGFVESTGLADYSGVVAACIGKQTKAAADAYGMQTYVAEKATIEALIDLVVKIKNKNIFKIRKRCSNNGSYSETKKTSRK